MNKYINPLSEIELSHVNDGPLPVIAYLTATGFAIISASIASFNSGYTVGRDIAAGESLRQPATKLK